MTRGVRRLLDPPSTETMLGILAADFLVIEKLRGFERSAWNATMQPLLFRTAGLASAISDRYEDEQKRTALRAVARAIIELMPPDEQGVADDAGWIRIEVAMTRARDIFDR